MLPVGGQDRGRARGPDSGIPAASGPGPQFRPAVKSPVERDRDPGCRRPWRAPVRRSALATLEAARETHSTPDPSLPGGSPVSERLAHPVELSELHGLVVEMEDPGEPADRLPRGREAQDPDAELGAGGRGITAQPVIWISPCSSRSWSSFSRSSRSRCGSTSQSPSRA